MSDFIRTSTVRIRGAATGEQNVPVKPEQFDAWLAEHDREIQAQVWHDAIEVALTVRPEMGLHINVSEYRQGKVDGLDIAVANMRSARARLTTTTERPTDG